MNIVSPEMFLKEHEKSVFHRSINKIIYKEIHPHSRTDPKYLSRALGNLVRNAIRYAGQAGPIELQAKQESDLIIITIADQGPGLPSEILSHIFDPFSRPEEARSRDTGGVGLGLSIVKSCVEACGGTIDCRNRKPNGLEFSVTLQSA